MGMRYLKSVLTAFVGLEAWLYVAGDIANWHSGLSAVSYVISMQGNDIYPVHIFPALTGPVWGTIAYLVILSGEFLVGALSLKGAWDMWSARKVDAASFNASKRLGLLGLGMAMVVWFGGFIVIGGALFQMWQSTMGSGSFNGAFVYSATAGLILLFVSRPDEQTPPPR